MMALDAGGAAPAGGPGMQLLLFVVVLLFIAACWTLVIGSQLGLSAFDIERYAVWRMTWALAYVVAGLSAVALGFMVLVAIIKPGPKADSTAAAHRDTGKPEDNGGGSVRIWYDGVRCRRPRSGRR